MGDLRPTARTASARAAKRRLVAVIGAALMSAACLPSPPNASVGSAEWALDPASLPIAEDATSLDGFVREIACASGRSPEGRVRLLGVEYRADAIVIAFGVAPLPGDQACPSNPAYPVHIELQEPVGGRVILDGNSEPPRDATMGLP